MASLRPGLQRIATGLLSMNRTAILAFGASPRVQCRSICHKDHLDPEEQATKPKPWPYRKRRWYPFYEVFGLDSFSKSRFDENSVLIVIEGLPCSGKTEFAHKLAGELGMQYFRDVDFEKDYLIKYNGFDWRSCNEIMPEHLHLIGINEWLERPDRGGVCEMQHHINDWRQIQYFDALAHIFNTGQGAILDKTIHCDKAYINAMAKLGHMPRETRDWFIEKVRPKVQNIKYIKRPHLVIYLDVPVEILYERAQKKWPGNKALTMDFLAELDFQYKNYVLPELDIHAFLLCYDWTEPCDFEYVIEDIENLDYEGVDPHTKKMSDWRFRFRSDYAEQRYLYTRGLKHLIKDNHVRYWGIPGIDHGPHDTEYRQRVMTLWAGSAHRYRLGWVPGKDSFLGMLFKKEKMWRKRYPIKGHYDISPSTEYP